MECFQSDSEEIAMESHSVTKKIRLTRTRAIEYFESGHVKKLWNAVMEVSKISSAQFCSLFLSAA